MADRQHDFAHDFVVVGGGPVGAVMALGLEAQGHDVALIERNGPVHEGLSESEAGPQKTKSLNVDARTVALSLASRRLLERYDAWPSKRIGAFAHMEVWEDRGTSVLRFGATDVAQDALGHIAEVRPWLAQLWQRLERSTVTCVVGRSVTRVDSDAGGYRLELSSDAAPEDDAEDDTSESVLAGMLIAADGARSVVRRELGVPMPLTDTGQSALAFAARVENQHEHTAFQRFLAEGPLALLPMADTNIVSVVWSARNDRADDLAGMSHRQLEKALERASELRLGRIEEVSTAVRFPLLQGVISNFCPRPDLVFIGDAARVIHPLAGQGVNLGFEDVRALLECTGHSPTEGLKRFARVRRARSNLAVTAMSALSAGYANQSPGPLLARNVLTRALGRSEMARKALVLEALGLGPVAKAS